MQIPDNEKQSLVQRRTELFNESVDALFEQIFNGSVSLGEGQQKFKNLVKGLHTSVAAISKGGWSFMSSRDWGKTGPILRKEYEWIASFFQYIYENQQSITLNALKYRARLYGISANKSAISVLAGFTILDLLPWMPKDGSTICLFKCKCYWNLTIVESRGNVNIVSAVWTVTSEETCETCIGRNGHEEILTLPSDVVIPTRIGGYD